MNEVPQPHIAMIPSDRPRYDLCCRIVFDGVEHVGHLCFADESWGDLGLSAHAGIED